MYRNVLIVNAYHDSNKGDAAILLGAIDLLRRFSPNAALTVLSRYSNADPRFQTAHRHLQREESSVRVLSSPFLDSQVGSGRSWWALRALATKAMIGNDALLGIPLLKPAVEVISDADLVVGVGGHYLFSKRTRPSDWERLARFSLPHVIARALGVRSILLGHSLGPFHGYIGESLGRVLLESMDTVVLREPISLAAVPWGSDLTTIRIAPDCAFALVPPSDEDTASLISRFGLERREYLAVTIRNWGSSQDRREYVSQLAEFLRDESILRYFSKIAVIAQCHGPDEAEDDRPISTELHAMLPASRAVLVEEDLSPRQLMAVFGGAKALVGTRFHSVIFGLLSGTPAISLSYFGPKSQGIMASVDLRRFSVDLHMIRAQMLKGMLADLMETDLRPMLLEQCSQFRTELRGMPL